MVALAVRLASRQARVRTLVPALRRRLSTVSDKEYDMVVVGGGPGGYPAAIKAGQMGLSVRWRHGRARAPGILPSLAACAATRLGHARMIHPVAHPPAAAQVACVEMRGSLGGTCLNVGCIPSKALLHSSHIYEEAATGFGPHGIKADNVRMELDKLMEHKTKVVTGLTSGAAHAPCAHTSVHVGPG